MLEGERLSPCDEKNKPKTKLKDEGIEKKSQPRNATAFEMTWTRNKPNRTEPRRIQTRTRTKLDLAWQQVADAVADDHKDHRRDRSVAPKTGDTSCVNKPLTR